jgi:tRNA nucleotidyltransferase (CCA-adding enzyme)
MNVEERKRVKSIAEEISRRGGRAYLVGGIVRDMLIGMESKDIDIEVFGIEPKTLKEILSHFGRTIFVGKSFGVFKLENIDFSLPQKKENQGEFYLTPQPEMGLKEACLRRDLTMNAVLYDILEEEFIDPLKGIRDIEKGVIRHTSDESFAHDPLRVLRVAQFSARFEYHVAEETNRISKRLVDKLTDIPRERIFMEIEKLLLRAKKPSLGFIWLKEIGALKGLFPELDVLSETEQNIYHPEGDVFIHTMLCLDALSVSERTLPVMLAVLCHDMGKATTAQNIDGELHFYNHASEGVRIGESFLRKMTDESGLIQEVLLFIKYHYLPMEMGKHQIDRKQVRRLSLKVDLPGLLKVHKADKLGRGKPENIDYLEDILRVYEEIKSEIKPLVLGRHLIALGLKPSVEFKGILQRVFDAQINEEFSTEEEGIEYTKKILHEKNQAKGGNRK